jgi:ParB-like chromosome segregation protein Spo0J
MVSMRWIAVEAIKPNARNARTHSKKQIRQIADSIAAFGFLVPILIDDSGVIIAGHGRYDAAVLLGLQEVPVIRVEGLSEATPLPTTRSLRMRVGTANSWRPSCPSSRSF